ncbi:MAG: hypothetical protein EP329_18665 [Deltaproteobacteria bacterium]|nr:MAG: hypothetical protein EP329_18665 [Deltaproteobacteria bacterium]
MIVPVTSDTACAPVDTTAIVAFYESAGAADELLEEGTQTFQRFLHRLIRVSQTAASTVGNDDVVFAGLTLLGMAVRRIDTLRAWQSNWDGFGSPAPSGPAITRAKELVAEAFATPIGSEWTVPMVSADEDGNVVLEWWCDGPNRLSLFVSDEATEYVRSWGEHISQEMDEGALSGGLELRELIRWVQG